ncbi:hypothetical protein [Flagellimonas lutimaris]|uniref:hypothetical protein n=1 Tax=Flagellimonas lutimaris TaxID=475082 RepID=UPI003F5CC4A5
MKFKTALLLFGINFSLAAQTNSFPTTGNVGVGTTNPSSPLEVWSSNNNRLLFNQSATPSVSFLPNNGNTIFHLSHTMDNRLTISQGSSVSSATRILTIRNTGQIGIGTLTPEEKLHVSGTATIVGDIGVPTGSYWQTGRHTLELQNLDAGDVVLSFHRAGYTNASIRHTSLGGLILSGTGTPDLYVGQSGRVGIGTSSPDTELSVKGTVHAEEVKVDLSVPGPDYVFKEGYDLQSLQEVQNYIKAHGHLPNIPSAMDMEANGIELGEMNMKLLEKIEELTLYILQLEEKYKKLEDFEARLKKMENKF